MVTSCGLVIKSCDLYLICHPTGAPKNSQWDIPKGLMEGTESKLETAYRETKEETGLNLIDVPGDVSIIGVFKYHKRNKKLVAFLLEAEQNLINEHIQCFSFIQKGKLKGRQEHDNFAWVSLDMAIELTHNTVSKVFKKIKKYL